MKNRVEIEKKYCCGCGLCNHFSKGYINESGYFRPNLEIENSIFDTSICYCNSFRNVKKNTMWGKIEEAYFGYSNDKITRKKASSGGILTEIIRYILSSNKVDYVVSIKTSEESPIKSETVFIHKAQDAILYSGSKYTASSSLFNLLDKIDMSKKYAVLGKPCDIRVLRRFIELNTEYSEVFTYLISFFCGGTPSYQANKKLLQKMNLEESTLKSFVYRGNGWPGKATGIDISGYRSEIEYEESWGQILGRDLQDICRFCWEGVGEAADISCGDGWYLEAGKPSFEERDGRNIIFARTHIGNKLLEEMNNKDLICLEKINDLNIVEQMQPGQFMRKASMFSRILAMRIMRRKVPNYNLCELISYAKHISIYDNIKMFGGTIKRILNGTIK